MPADKSTTAEKKGRGLLRWKRWVYSSLRNTLGGLGCGVCILGFALGIFLIGVRLTASSLLIRVGEAFLGLAMMSAIWLGIVAIGYRARRSSCCNSRNYEEVSDWLISLADGANAGRYSVAIDVLGDIRDKRATSAIVGALSDDADGIRLQAVEALIKISDPRALPALVVALRDGYRTVRRRAVAAVDQLGWRPENESERIDYLIAKETWSDVVAAGDNAIEPLIRSLNDNDAVFRKNAIIALGKLGGEMAYIALSKRDVMENDTNVRIALKTAMQKSKSR